MTHKFKENDRAIEFTKKDYLGNIINLNDYKGKKILITFFRGSSCPFCNLRLQKMIHNYNEFKQKNIQVITFFSSSKEEILEYAGKQNAPFPIIPDPNLEIYKKYHLEKSYLSMLKTMFKMNDLFNVMKSPFFNMKAILKSMKDDPLTPADILIDEKQNIYKAYYGKTFGDHLSLKEILDWE